MFILKLNFLTRPYIFKSSQAYMYMLLWLDLQLMTKHEKDKDNKVSLIYLEKKINKNLIIYSNDLSWKFKVSGLNDWNKLNSNATSSKFSSVFVV